MADFEQKAKRSKKRKLKSTEEKEEGRLSKAFRSEHSDGEKKEANSNTEHRRASEKIADPPWRNLQLILLLQSKDFDLQEKVELAFNYVRTCVSKEGDDSSQGSETICISRVIVFLNNWVQSLLISSEKKIRAEGYKPQLGIVGSCLDYRCWEIFKFNLEESLKLHVPLSFSRDFLRVIHCIARSMLSRLNVVPPHAKDNLNSEVFELYNTVLDCVFRVFSFHGGVSNENLEVWILNVATVVELVQKIFNDKLDGCKVGIFVLQLSHYILEPFAKFLRVHPTRKNGFRDFIDKLLEPLLHMLTVLHLHISGRNCGRARNLLTLVEEVLSQGLFHPTHIDGFLCLQSTRKYITSNDGFQKDFKAVIKSYHRHLFDMLEKIMTRKNFLALDGIGKLFCLFVGCINKQKGASANSQCLSGVSAEMRKSVFDFFVQMIEPPLMEINSYLQAKLEVGPVLEDIHSTLKSTNKILANFMHKKVYIQTEDTSEGSCFNFLKVVYDTVVSFSAKIKQLWLTTFDLNKGTHRETLILIPKELIIMIRYLMEIEYEVIGNDLESVWRMMFSCTALGLSLMDSPNCCSLASETVHLGCQLVNLYSDLRQVNTATFALCKVVRHLLPPDSDGQVNYCESYLKSVRMLLCSEEFRLTVCTAIKSIPQGQAGDCIRQLETDISESLEWIKVNCSLTAEKDVGILDWNSSEKLCFNLQAELLGRGLSEMYTLILGSITVTTGNSNLVGVLLKDLMTVIRPSMSSLVMIQPDTVNEFLSVVTGRNFQRGLGCKSDLMSGHWLVLFFLRLYMSCRFLYRQAISFMPPDISRKMSEGVGDPFTANSGMDWLERTDWALEGYFSWIAQPSAPLLTIIQAVSDFYFQGTSADCSPLTYVLNAMALQRLVDLNRLIKSFEYLLQRNKCLILQEVVDGAGLSLYHKESRKWTRCVSDFRQEAADLTNFIMGCLPLVANNKHSISTSNDEAYKDISAHALHKEIAWDFCVSAINEESLPCATWWLVCQNVDIWSIHASKKKLKTFLSLLIQSSLLCTSSSSVRKHDIGKPGHVKNITAHQISLRLLSDTVLYEQRFVRRYMTSRFRRLLEKFFLPILCNFRELDLSSSPNWSEVLCAIDASSGVVSGNNHVMNGCFSVAESISHSSHELPVECFTACQSLLNLLCWMPKGYLSSRSFSLYATFILNLERLLVGSLLNCHGALHSHNHYELLRLFISCRKTLKILLMASCEEQMEARTSSFTQMLSKSSFPFLWLLKSQSAVIGLLHAFSEENATQVKDMIFSLMDHTSYVFLTSSKYLFIDAIRLLRNSRESHEEQPSSRIIQDQSDLIELDTFLESPEYINAWRTLVLIAETLKEQTLKDNRVGVLDLNKLSSPISCFQGFLWGLASAFDYIDAKDTNLSRLKFKSIHKLNFCTDVFAEFSNYFIHKLYVEDDQVPQSFCDLQTHPMSEFNSELLGLNKSSCRGSIDVADILLDAEQWHSGTANNFVVPSDIKENSDRSIQKKRSCTKNADSESFLTKIESFEQRRLKKSLLQGFLRGEHPEAAFFLRQLFIASSAILRLNLKSKCTSLLPSSVLAFISISQALLLELANIVEVPQPFSFVWLDGIAKFLEELGNHFPTTNPTLSRGAYVKLIDLHFRAIGKCISLQGKGATLASYVIESSADTLNDSMILSNPQGPYYLNEFKARLRMSFKTFVKKPSELHLLSAIQALERALVGVQEGCIVVYEIDTGSPDGGKVSPIVAAAIDCLDLVLEFVTGRRRLGIVRQHIQSIVACLFNIILHLQGSVIFYGCRGDANPDPGAVILMCVGVLTRVFGKHALFQMDLCYVVQSLRLPAVLFQNFLRLKISEASTLSDSVRLPDIKDMESVESVNSFVVDRKFSIDLYAACCRLLCTVLKHHKSVCERFVALVEDSVTVLIHCLEIVDIDPVVREGYFTWETQEGVKCASSLRRIYEEMRQQKDIFGPHCFQFLSNYIWIYSGYGPLKTGIRREIDEALRPGVYALIDSCSTDDLQRLHMSFGEGPCRSTLATLQHDYKSNFQYEGKV